MSMKILLVYPYCLEDRLHTEDIRVVPQGLYYVAAILAAAGLHLGWLDRSAGSVRIFPFIKKALGIVLIVAAILSFRVFHQSGPVVQWRAYDKPLLREAVLNGKPAILGNYMEVTERRKMVDALHESEEKFRLLAENSIMGTFVLQDSKMIYVSPTFASAFGYRPEEIANTMSPSDFVHPDDKPFMMQRLTDRYTGRATDNHISLRGVKKDGSVIYIEASSVLTEYRGKPAVMGTFIDITERKQAEEALRKSEERYRQLAENAAEAILVVQDDTVKFINPKGMELSGYSAEELASKPFASFIYPEDIHMVADRYVKRLRGEPVPDRYDFRIIRKDGEIRWGELNAVPISWEDRPAVLCFMNDITERKQTEEALRESEERYRTILEETGDGYFETDLAGRFTFVNDAQACLLGYPREQIIGTDFRAFTPGERVAPVVEAYSHLYETGEPLRNFIDEVIRKGGSRGFAETSAFTIRNDKGETVGFRGVRRDITERRQMEEALRHSEENYRALFNSSVIGTVVLDAETGRVVMANQAAVGLFEFGSPQECIGRSPLEFVLPDDRETIRQVIGQDLFEQDARRIVQSRAVTKSGREIWLSVTAARVMHEGRLAALISFADITEQKLQNDKLMIADRLVSIGELAAGAAHELNNPLASIIGLSELLMEKNTPDYIRRDLAMIRDEARRAANVTSNLLTFARKHRPVKQLTQMNAIIEDVLKLRAYAHKSNSIKVERHLAPDLPEMLVDPFQMQQVFLNIVINAEYFMTQAHSKGTLVITTTRHNGGVKVSFADDGPGIPPEDLSRIFDPFFTTKEAGKGTGLGLSICHGIVAAHGAQIHATSQAGEGATISVELPFNGNNHAEVML